MKRSDTIKKIQVFFRFLFEIYKIISSCLLVVFVPQECNNGQRACSFKDNFQNLDPYNTFALYFNITTSIVFFLYFSIELYRERIYIQLLDINENKSYENYDNEIKKYPRIKKRIDDVNFVFYYFNIFLILIFLINIIISLIVVTNFYLNDLTIFITITNTILILDKLLRSYTIARKSYYEKKAYSMYTRKDIIYNDIDKKIKKRRLKKIKKKLKNSKEKITIEIK